MTNTDNARSGSRLTFSRSLLVSLLLHSLLLLPMIGTAGLLQRHHARYDTKLQVELFGMLTERQVAAQELAQEAVPMLPPEPAPLPEPQAEEPKTLVEKTPPSPVQMKQKAPEQKSAPVQRRPETPQHKAEGGEEKRAQQTTVQAPSDEDLQKRYIADVVRRIQRKLIYPADSRRLGHVGTPQVRFTIDADGRITPGALTLHQSCGYPALDRQALRAVEVSAPFTPPPKRMELIVAISFAEKI